MIENYNISHCAINVFNILKKLYLNDCEKDALLDGFSDDTFLIYLNTLRKAGINIEFSKKYSKYKLLSGLNILSVDDDVIKQLFFIKRMLVQKNLYKDLILYNVFLSKLKVYTNYFYAEKIQEVIDTKPIDSVLQNRILDIENYIQAKMPIVVEYSSTGRSTCLFRILPKKITLSREKLYLWAEDDSIEDLRCLRLDKIIDIKTLDNLATINRDILPYYAVCKFFNKDDFKTINIDMVNIIEENEKEIIVKVKYDNSFEFLQELLAYSDKCQIIEPIKLKKNISDLLRKIRRLHEE